MSKYKNIQQLILITITHVKTWFIDFQLAYAEAKGYGTTPFRQTGIYYGRLHGCGYKDDRCRHGS